MDFKRPVYRKLLKRITDERRFIQVLSGPRQTGKTTLALEAERQLFIKGYQVYVLDGDNIRHGLNKNLGFSPEDRTENIRRISEVGKLFVDTGVITMTAFISPYRADREAARALFADGEFVEILMDVPLETCENRDPKGLYKKARAGEIKEFTGISAPYEEPQKAELTINTGNCSPQEAAIQIMSYLEEKGMVRLTDE